MIGNNVIIVPGPPLARQFNAQVRVRVGADKELFGDTLTQLDRARKQVQHIWMFSCDIDDSCEKAKLLAARNPYEITQRLRDASHNGSGGSAKCHQQINQDEEGNNIGLTTFLINQEKAKSSLSSCGAADDIVRGKGEASKLKKTNASLVAQIEARRVKRDGRMIETAYMALALTPREELERLDLDDVLYTGRQGASIRKSSNDNGLNRLSSKKMQQASTPPGGAGKAGTPIEGRTNGRVDVNSVRRISGRTQGYVDEKVRVHKHTCARTRTLIKLDKERKRRKNEEVSKQVRINNASRPTTSSSTVTTCNSSSKPSPLARRKSGDPQQATATTQNNIETSYAIELFTLPHTVIEV